MNWPKVRPYLIAIMALGCYAFIIAVATAIIVATTRTDRDLMGMALVAFNVVAASMGLFVIWLVFRPRA